MKNKSKQGRKAKKIRSYQYEISEDSVSSFAGLSLTEYLANRLGLWKNLQDQVPDRQGKYERNDIIRGAVNGLLSGSRGTASLSEIAEDAAILKLLGIKELPGEKIFWEELERLGTDTVLESLNKVLSQWACKFRLLDPAESRMTPAWTECGNERPFLSRCWERLFRFH